MIAIANPGPQIDSGRIVDLEAFTDLILRSVLLRASRRMSASRVLPSFETLASQAPQDEAGVFSRSRTRAACFNGCYALRRTPDNSISAPDGQITDWPVHPSLQKYSDFQNTQISFISLPVLSHRGAARDRHGRGTGCGGRERR